MSSASPERPRLSDLLRHQPEHLEPGLQWVAEAAGTPFEKLPLAGMAVDALGRPVLVLDADELEATDLVGLLDAVATIRREGPPLASTFLLPEEVRVFLLSSRVRRSMRRRLQVLAGAFPLAWWECVRDEGGPLRLTPVALEELPTSRWAEGLPAATSMALHRLLRGAGRLRPTLEVVPMAGGIQLRHQDRPVLVLFQHRHEVFARATGPEADLRRLSRTLVVDHLLDVLLGHLVLEEEAVSAEA
ncbi:MAG: hypothetical protein ACYTF3_08050 [Planctomycetota bacterium]|jgi:hypothetical protein